jgi:hypothetical protein
MAKEHESLICRELAAALDPYVKNRPNALEMWIKIRNTAHDQFKRKYISKN